MNNQEQTIFKKRFIIIIASLLVLILVTSIIYWFVNGNKNPEGDSLVIQNLDSYTQGKPQSKDTLNYIEHALLNAVNMNVSEPVKDKSIQDVIVRDKSFSQTYDNNTYVHTVKFIVDIKSIKQSYDVSYQWSDRDKHSSELSEWGTTVKCLPVEKLIYGNFNCKDMFSQMKKTADDPLLEKVLPYEGDFYSIRYYTGEKKGNIIIAVQIMITPTGERTQKQFDIYKKEAQDWLVSQGVDLTKYVLVYRDLNNDIVIDDDGSGSEEEAH